MDLCVMLLSDICREYEVIRARFLRSRVLILCCTFGRGVHVLWWRL